MKPQGGRLLQMFGNSPRECGYHFPVTKLPRGRFHFGGQETIYHTKFVQKYRTMEYNRFKCRAAMLLGSVINYRRASNRTLIVRQRNKSTAIRGRTFVDGGG